MFVLLAEVEWTRGAARRALIAVAVVAVGCALVAIAQYLARDLFLNQELFDANQLHAYFRVNSIFFDPNIFGRYLALAMTALAACIAWGGARRDSWPGWRCSPLGLVALAFTYSITGFAALLAGLGMVAILRWGWRGSAARGASASPALAALLVAGGTPTSDIEDDRSIDSGHADLFAAAWSCSGSIAGRASGPAPTRTSAGRSPATARARSGARSTTRSSGARTTVSHSEPVTVAAEQGVIGLLVYVALLVVRARHAVRRAAPDPRWRARWSPPASSRCSRSFGYTGFTTDPATWALLGARRRPAPRAPPEPAAHHHARCSSTCGGSRPRAPPTRPRASSRS